MRTICRGDQTIQKFTTLELSDQPDKWYAYGVLQFTSGFNKNVVMTVANNTQKIKQIQTFVPTPFKLATGDTGVIYPGCDKTIKQCFHKFNNVIHFRGEPFTPQIQSGL
jgi:uncharacterized phage protein (TIGR02218 family)